MIKNRWERSKREERVVHHRALEDADKDWTVWLAVDRPGRWNGRVPQRG